MGMALKPEQYFWLVNGKPVKSLGELSSVLASMPQSVYDYHVTADRNDFSNWIKGVFKGEILANDIENAKSPKEMKSKVDSFLHPKKEVKEVPKSVVKKKPKVVKAKPKKAVKKKVSKKRVVRKKSVKKVEEEGHSIVYEELLKDKWSKEPKKYFYRALVKYGILEFIFGIAVGAFIVLVLKGMI